MSDHKVTIIHLLASVGFWPLLIVNIATPGEAHWVLQIIQAVCLYTMIATSFYTWGTLRKTTYTYYEKSNA